MKRYNVLLLILIALAMHSITFAADANNGIKDAKENPYVKGQKEMSFKEVEVPQAIKDKLKDKILESDGGNEFYCIMPPNDHNASTGEMAIYICSGKYKNTTIIIERTGTGQIAELKIDNPYQVAGICSTGKIKNATIYEDIGSTEILAIYPEEFSEDAVTGEKGYKIYTLPDPNTGIYPDIFVYVGSFRAMTADGYMALPTSGLGNHYVHCSQGDNDETNSHSENNNSSVWRTGFSCVATQPHTQIEYKLVTSMPYCITFNHKVGDRTYVSPILQPGEVWSVCNGLNTTQNMGCDFSGTIISSDKNFACISWSQRTSVPLCNPGISRDNLCEQLLPTDKWGKKHITVQFEGSFSKESRWKNTGDWWDANPGNNFRVSFKEPDTELDVVFYDLLVYQRLGGMKFKSTREGFTTGFIVEILPVHYAAWPNMKVAPHSVTGVAHWTANKPYQIMMYSQTQTYWWNSGELDPAMLLIPPVEQYGNQTTFITACSSSSSEFKEHYVTLYAQGPMLNKTDADLDPNAIAATLGSIYVTEDGGRNIYPYQIISKDPGFYSQRVPETEYYFSRFPLKQNEVYHVEGRTRLSASVYGWGGAISYAWPASMKLAKSNTFDREDPKVSNEVSCAYPTRPNDYGYVVLNSYWVDTTNRPKSDWEDTQEDLGLVKAPNLVFDETENLTFNTYSYYIPSFPTSPNWRTGANIKSGAIRFRTIDPYVDVFGIVYFEDEAGNSSYDTLIYIADKLEFFDVNGRIKTEIDFGEVTADGSSYSDIIIVKNMDNHSIVTHIEDLFLQDGGKGVYEITRKCADVLLSGQQDTIIITYTPQNAGQVTENLLLYTQCLYWNLYIYGGSGFPRIEVTDCDFGQRFVGDWTPNDQGLGTVWIKNNGSADLLVSGYHFGLSKGDVEQGENGPFGYRPSPASNEPSPTNIITVKKNDSVRINYTRFKPASIGYDSVRLYFESNAQQALDPNNYKDYAFLEGYGIKTGPLPENYNWERRRVKTINSGTVKFINEGNTPVTVKELASLNWSLSGDTLYSAGRHYFIPNIKQYAGRTLQPFGESETYSDEEREMKVAVYFNPQSEYPHLESGNNVGTCQIKDSFVVNFTDESKVPDYTIISYLFGEAFLPKIETTGYTWKTPTQLNTPSDQEYGEVNIYNPSYTSQLTIKKIALLETDQYEEFNLGDLNRYTGATVGISDDAAKSVLLIGGIVFTPTSTSPAIRRAFVEIISDAGDGSGNNGTDINPTRIDTVMLEAEAFDIGLEVGDVDYKTITRCDNPVASLAIRNLSTTNVLEVYDISIIPQDAQYADLFVQLQKADIFKIDPSSSLSIGFRFDACNWVDDKGNRVEGGIEVKFVVTTNMGKDTSIFKVLSHIIPLKMTLPNIANTEPNTVLDIPINIQLANTNVATYSFENANITSFTLKLKTERQSLFFEGGFADNGWDYSGSNQDANGLITITAKRISSSSTNIVTAGNFCIPRVRLLLSTLRDIPLEIVGFDVNDRECCISWSAEKGNVHSTICAQDARGGQVMTGTQFGLPPVSPNPYTAKNLEFKYNIGLDGDATIEIYNSNGELVKSVLNGYVKVGEYTANADISNFSSGAYTIVLKAGQFEEKQKLIIVK